MVYSREDSMIFVEIFWIGFFLKIALACSRKLTVYQKNSDNFVWGFLIDENSQKCRKFLVLDWLFKTTALILQYVLHVNFPKFLGFCKFCEGARTRQTFDGWSSYLRPPCTHLTWSPPGGPRRPIFPGHSKICGPDGPTFSRIIEDLALVRSHPNAVLCS